MMNGIENEWMEWMEWCIMEWFESEYDDEVE